MLTRKWKCIAYKQAVTFYSDISSTFSEGKNACDKCCAAQNVAPGSIPWNA